MVDTAKIVGIEPIGVLQVINGIVVCWKVVLADEGMGGY
jgi:hypothetical protein